MSIDNNLKYMIIGTGGTGGAIGAHLAHAGNDVTFIARGRQLEAMRANGLRLHRPDVEFTVDPVKVYNMDDCPADQKPDVIFVCVKGYSVEGTIPFIRKVAGQDTIVIPILNVFGTGGRMQKYLPGITVLDGCIYIWTELREPGLIWMSGTIFRVVFGLRRDQKELEDKLAEKLDKIRSDLESCGITGIVSDNIERDALRKFSFVSPQGATGLYYNTTVGAVHEPGEIRDCFSELVVEISDLADAMGIGFGEDILPENLRITDESDPGITTSMQKDVAAGRPSEVDGLIYEVVRLGEKHGVKTPRYAAIAEELRSRGLK
jgi:2-dehydropantoate 2-reductase